MDLRVLWTISGSMGTMSDIEMLKNAKAFGVQVVTADTVDKDTAAFVSTGKKYILPKVRDSKYIDSLLDICKRERITTIIPQYTDELLPLSENIRRFREIGVEVLVTEDTERLKIANDKVRLYQFFKDRDFVPAYKLVSEAGAVIDTAVKLGYPGVPICVKPADGEGGKGFRILTEETADMFNESGSSLKTDLDTYVRQLRKLYKLPQLMVSEYLPGREYSVDCVCKDGKPYICIPRQRLETSMGVASVSLIEKNDELIGRSNEIIKALGLSYNINIQFKYSNEEKPKLLEINPRVSGSLVANYGAGINMLELSLKLAYGIPVEELPHVKWGTKMIRYWDQVFTQA